MKNTERRPLRLLLNLLPMTPLLTGCLGSLPADEGKLPALDATALTHLPSANLVGALPALDGSQLIKINAGNLIGNLPALDGSKLTSTGTVPVGVGCRLSLVAAEAVPMASEIAGIDLTGNRIYLVPFRGNSLALYDGATWRTVPVPDGSPGSTLVSLQVPQSPTSNYDVFAALNPDGTIGLSPSSFWSGPTTRANALALYQGVYVKAGNPTQRYLGTFRTTTAGFTEDSRKRRLVWNYYNRTSRTFQVNEPTGTWPVSVNLWQQVAGHASNQVELVVGISEDTVRLNANEVMEASVAVSVGISVVEDNEPPGSSLSGTYGNNTFPGTPPSSASVYSTLHKTPVAGYHSYKWMETSNLVGVVGVGSPVALESALTGEMNN